MNAVITDNILEDTRVAWIQDDPGRVVPITESQSPAKRADVFSALSDQDVPSLPKFTPDLSARTPVNVDYTGTVRLFSGLFVDSISPSIDSMDIFFLALANLFRDPNLKDMEVKDGFYQ